MLEQPIILHDKIKELRKQADDLELIGGYCYDIISYLKHENILSHYVIHASGSAMIVLKEYNDFNEGILKYALKKILLEQSGKDLFFLDWVCFKQSTISHIYCDWYREDIVHNNGWNGKDL